MSNEKTGATLDKERFEALMRRWEDDERRLAADVAARKIHPIDGRYFYGQSGDYLVPGHNDDNAHDSPVTDAVFATYNAICSYLKSGGELESMRISEIISMTPPAEWRPGKSYSGVVVSGTRAEKETPCSIYGRSVLERRYQLDDYGDEIQRDSQDEVDRDNA